MERETTGQHTFGPARLNRELELEPGAFALVLSGPPGVGKTSIGQALLKRNGGIQPCVTTTTRRKRRGEVDGRDYHFISEKAFREKLDRGEFVEWAKVYGALYGATLDAVSRAFSGGGVMLLVVDVQGASHWQEVLQERCVRVFVMPPSLKELKKRLAGRKTEGAADLERRMQNVRREIAQAKRFDYLVVNHNLEQAVSDILAVVRAERCRPWRMPDALLKPGAA